VIVAYHVSSLEINRSEGDLHPGNILVTGKYPNLKMVLLDCGLVLEMGPAQHVNLVKVLGAFTKKDGRLAAQLMVDMSAERQQAQPIDVERFVNGVAQLCVLDASQVCLRLCLRAEPMLETSINRTHGRLLYQRRTLLKRLGTTSLISVIWHVFIM